jgi:hypothetical protein
VAIAHKPRSLHHSGPQNKAPRGLAPQRNLGTIDSKYTRIAARGGMPWSDRMTRQKTEFHQPSRVFFRQVQAIQDSRLPVLQFREIRRFRVVLCVPNLFDSRLHLEPSIYLECCKVKLLEYQDLIASCN